jgi:hypothetical protein
MESTNTTPMSAEPTRLIASVVVGNVSDAAGNHTDKRQRIHDPRTPPTAMTANRRRRIT